MSILKIVVYKKWHEKNLGQSGNTLAIYIVYATQKVKVLKYYFYLCILMMNFNFVASFSVSWFIKTRPDFYSYCCR